MILGKVIARLEEKLDRILQALAESVPASQVKILEEQIIRLEEQNKQLFDTIMSRNWDEYARLKEDSTFTPYKDSKLEPEEDYSLAGEIIDGRSN